MLVKLDEIKLEQPLVINSKLFDYSLTKGQKDELQRHLGSIGYGFDTYTSFAITDKETDEKPANYALIPNQYFVFASEMFEFASELYKYFKLFEKLRPNAVSLLGSYNQIKTNIRANQELIQNFESEDDLDLFAKFLDKEDSTYRLGSKRLINDQGKPRGSRDCFGSVILKEINLPDASSSVFGRLVYDLCQSPTTYRNVYNAYCLAKSVNQPSRIDINYNIVLLPKPFLLLAGISGTGKTRFVRDQAKRSRGDKPDASDNYKLVAVRPDWHEPSDLLGYVSRISGEPKYIATEFLKFLIQAWQEVYENKGTLHIVKEGTRPFWLCLDEMNLAPVEQYFADYLSILESREWKDEIYTCLPLISKSELVLLKESFDQENLSEADRDLYLQKIFENDELWSAFNEHGGIPIPPNLIVAGTVNMDETTHGFSRKVIDRALTLDFQEFFPNNFDEIFDPKTKPKTLSFSCETHIKNSGQLKDVKADSDGKKSIEFLQGINSILQDTSFQLAFRALNELLLSVKCFSPENGENLVAVWDDFLMQKVLPRIEGDADKLKFSGEDESGLLIDLKNLVEKKFIEICPKEDSWQRPDLLRENLNEGKTLDCDFKSLKKLDWMHNRLKQNQYTSFWA